MFAYPLRTAALAAAAMIGLSGCAYNGLYSGVSVGLGNSGYYDPYYGSGYGYGAGYPGYGYGYGFDPYWGWNDGFYYPGTGYYVYDTYRRPFRWTDAQRRYWTQRRERTLASGFRQIATNWSEFERSNVSGQQIVRSVDRPVRIERSVERPARFDRSNRAMRIERKAERSETQSSVRSQRRSVTQSSSSDSDHSNRGRGRGRDGNRED